MARKLSASTWTAFVAKQNFKLDDKALVKALAAFEKTDEHKPETRLEALKDVDAEIARQVIALGKRKKELGDKSWKEAKDELDVMLGESERLSREARAAKVAAAEAGATGATAVTATAAALAALAKALAGVDKIDKGKPQDRLDALKDVDAEITREMVALGKRRKDLGEKVWKEAKDKLDAMLAESEHRTRETRVALADAEADDEPDTPVLLTTKMIPLLRDLRKGEVRMHALICTAGKNTAVLIMRRPISTARRPLLAQAVDAKGGMKYIPAECEFDRDARVLAFMVRSPGGQLAKRVRQALLDQTQLRLRVKVRGEDGVEEHDGEDAGESEEDGKAQASKAPPGGPASAAQMAYTQRLLKVRGRYEQALRARHPESTKLRAVMGLASEKADEKNDYAAAIQALQMVERLLDAVAANVAGPEAASPSPQAPGGRSAGASIVQLQSARLGWVKLRKAVQDDIDAVAKRIRSIVHAHNDDPQAESEYEEGDLDEAIQRLYKSLAPLDDRLVDALDAALAAEGEQRLTLQRKAREIVAEYKKFVDSDALIHRIDDNPFQPCNVRGRVDATLTALAKAL